MIYFAGAAEMKLVVSADGLSLQPDGYLYNTANAVRQKADPRVSILTKLSNDGPGRLLLEALVHDRIVFDPELLSLDLPSLLVAEDRLGRTSRYDSHCAQTAVSSEELLASLQNNSDVDTVVLAGTALYYQPLFSSLLDAVTFLNPRPFIVIDPAIDSYPHPDEGRLMRQFSQAAQNADCIVLRDGEAERLGTSPESAAPLVYLAARDGVSVYRDGKACDSFAGGIEDIYGRIIRKEHQS